MKRLTLAVILGCALALAVQAQTTTIQPPQVFVTATKISQEGLVTHMSGKVTIRADKVVIEADEADFHSDTQEIEVRGHVTARILSASNEPSSTITADRILFRLPQSKP